MKKRLLMTAVLCVAMTVAGCANGNTKTTESSTTKGTEAQTSENADAATESSSESAKTEAAAERPEYKALDYVTLGQYKGLEVTLAPTEVTDEEIQSEIQSTLSQNEKLTTLEEGTVEEGDVANIDYEGKIDGEAFDGGTDKGFDLTIGSGSFIEGFESGLVGKKIGGETDLNLKFPDTYTNADVAGKDVVFHVTVNSVKRAPELTDELVGEISDYKTVDEYKKSIEDSLIEQKKSVQDSQKLNDLMSQVYENSEIKGYPQELVDYNIKQYRDYYEGYAEQSDMTFADFLEQNLQMSEEDFNTQVETTVKQSLEQEMLLRAIAESEGITISDEEFAEGAEKYAVQLGAESADALVEQYGKSMVEISLMQDKAIEIVQNSAVVKDAADTESETSSEGSSESGSEKTSEASSEKESETEKESQTKAAE